MESFSPRRGKGLAVLAAVALVLVAGWTVTVQAAQEPAAQDTPYSRSAFPDLVAGLTEIEGCLGVEVALTQSGKNVIFAWFEDKEAAARWYWSDAHQGAMSSFFPDSEPSEPMEDVPENVGPILAIASITMSSEREIDEVTLPIKQISIELYTPITGGLSLGGRFAPEGLKIPRRKVVVDESR